MKPLPQSIEPQLQPTSIYSTYLKPQMVNYSSKRKNSDNVIIYSSVFVHNYLIGCASNGTISVWDINGKKSEVGTKRGLEEVDGCKPILW